ncbi:MAG: flavodoxin [Marinilabiliales bacterium]|nr:MAG: flavodoxin [Marinilabiliales bacterium]
MKKIGLFYSFQTTRTAEIAEKISIGIGEDIIDKIDVMETDFGAFENYNLLIFGIPTWFDGELPGYWDELLPGMESLKWKDRKIALFGLGDQRQYPANFGDAVGIMAEFLEQFQAEISGYTSVEGYTFLKSEAQRDDKFTGLLLDEDNQQGLTDQRVKDWVVQLKDEWKL